ncbi:beta-lactamase [Geoanaerobacter pelophilus]|uniref:Beta-lactamase n=1 Tax=Geoanaerobacter pelophilus TaxID=60036 RepID=A0ABQ0MGF9_9BACT|nr:serine hydrolase domain-containing protein [Geoanaerobacter pelophilus]GAW66088.1 beta-lactamase [Geoanaerobacter pelophilus]
MRVIILILMLFPLLVPQDLFASVDPVPPGLVSNLDLLLERAMSENLIAGGVVVVGNHEGILATASRGQVSSAAGAEPITDRTVFDLASLTKVVATTPAMIKLLDEGKINLADPVSRWFPEFEGSQLTVLHLLTHTSGLADVHVGSSQPIQGVIRKAASQLARKSPGTSFDYADINFILLGELVRRVSGEPLDVFCKEEIYEPLGTRVTQFLPPAALVPEIAPTSGNRGGVVQDENARRLGGVAGHAGVFSSAHDLSRYARLLLGKGTLDGRRILSEQAVAQMTTPYLCNNGRVKRALGWDMSSPFSAPKGSFFSDSSFGHTGYSGSSIWIDPEQDLFVIMLTRREDYRNVKSFNQLRRDISTYAAADFRAPGSQLPQPVPVAELPQIKNRVLLASAAEVIEIPVRRSKAASHSKWGIDRRAAKCSTKKADRHLAKARPGSRTAKVASARSGHKNSRVAKVARNESGKKRRLTKS